MPSVDSALLDVLLQVVAGLLVVFLPWLVTRIFRPYLPDWWRKSSSWLSGNVRRAITHRWFWPLVSSGLLLVILILVVSYIIIPIFCQYFPANCQRDPGHVCVPDAKLMVDFVDGPRAAEDLLGLFKIANQDLFNHIDEVEQGYLNGEEHRGITYIWGAPGVGKSLVTRQRLKDQFQGPSCLVKLSDLFTVESGRLPFEVGHKADLKTLDGQKEYDRLPTVAQPTEYSLEGLLSTAGCLQEDRLVPLVIVDDLDEVHSETTNLILRSIDDFIVDVDLSATNFVHIFVVGRTEGFSTWYRDPDRTEKVRDILTTFSLNGVALFTTGDLGLLAQNMLPFIEGRQDHIDLYIQFITRHPILSYSIRTLAIANMITDRSRLSPLDTEPELMAFLFDELLRRATSTHGRPESRDEEYRYILEEIAVKYGDELDAEGYFIVEDYDTVPIDENGQGAVLVTDVLDHSGIVILEPEHYSILRYRFEPLWIHAYLVELRNLRLNPEHELQACHE